MLSAIVNKIMFDYMSLNQTEIENLLKKLDLKIIRWMAINHPDNKTRKHLLRRTNVTVGNDSIININIMISDNYKKLVYIGDRVAVAPNVTIIAATDPNNSNLKEFQYVRQKLIREAKVIIEDDAWIGSNTTILPGITIGKGAIVGAGSVVTRDVSPNHIAGGVPCKTIRVLST